MSSLKNQLNKNGYSLEEIYFFKENHRKIIEFRKKRGLSPADPNPSDSPFQVQNTPPPDNLLLFEKRTTLTTPQTNIDNSKGSESNSTAA